jgi:hypothetical protein
MGLEAPAMDRDQEGTKLAEKIMEWVSTQHVRTDVASIAFMRLAVGAIANEWGMEAGQEFFNMMCEFIQSRMSQNQPEEKKFWNLMAEKGYDSPVVFPKKKAKAARR